MATTNTFRVSFVNGYTNIPKCVILLSFNSDVCVLLHRHFRRCKHLHSIKYLWILAVAVLVDV